VLFIITSSFLVKTIIAAITSAIQIITISTINVTGITVDTNINTTVSTSIVILVNTFKSAVASTRFVNSISSTVIIYLLILLFTRTTVMYFLAFVIPRSTHHVSCTCLY
jgi:hypothetical protein